MAASAPISLKEALMVSLPIFTAFVFAIVFLAYSFIPLNTVIA